MDLLLGQLTRTVNAAKCKRYLLTRRLTADYIQLTLLKLDSLEQIGNYP